MGPTCRGTLAVLVVVLLLCSAARSGAAKRVQKKEAQDDRSRLSVVQRVRQITRRVLQSAKPNPEGAAPPTDEAGHCATDGVFHDLKNFYADIDAYLEHFYVGPEYHKEALDGLFSLEGAGGKPDLYGAIDFLYAVYAMGELDVRTTEESRAAWASFIQGYQDEETGYWPKTAGHAKAHATGYATSALKILGARPLHPFKWADEYFKDAATIHEWLDNEVNWHIVWIGSHSMGLPAALYDTGAMTKELSKAFLDELDERNDPHTGFWKEGVTDKLIKKGTAIDLGGAAHFWWQYRCGARPIPNPGVAIQNIDKLQRKTGLWGNWFLNGNYPQCLDLDSLNGYALAYEALSQEASEEELKTVSSTIVKSLERYMCGAEKHLNVPGALMNEDSPYFKNPHKLAGGLSAVAEANALYEKLTGQPLLKTPHPWKLILRQTCWL